MQVSVARGPWYAAGLAAIVAAAVAGCSPSTSASAGNSAQGKRVRFPRAANALDAVKLAAKTSSSANSFTGTMDLQATVKPGAASSAGGRQARSA